MKKIIFSWILIVVLAILAVNAMSAKADAAYLHVANAQAYAQQHVWSSAPCYYSYSECWKYPAPTSFYERISNTKVRVEIKLGWIRCSYSKLAYRVFAVVGDDSSPSITSSGSAPYWACPS